MNLGSLKGHPPKKKSAPEIDVKPAVICGKNEKLVEGF